MKRIFILLLFTAVSYILPAQSPGYRGDRFSVSLNGFANYALMYPNINNVNKGISFNYRISASLDYVLARRFSLGVAFHYWPTAFRYQKSCNDYINGIPNNFIGKYYYYGKIKVFGLSLNPKIFLGKGSIAPLGNYIKPEIIIAFYKVDNQIFGLSSMTGIPPFKNHSPYFDLGFGLEVGRSFIFFNRMLFEIGLQGGVLINTQRGDNPGYSEYIGKYAGDRLLGNYSINMKVGVGLLAF